MSDQVVYKYVAPLLGTSRRYNISRYAKFVHVGFDPNGDLCFWAEVSKAQPDEEWTINNIGTGMGFNKTGTHHIGTAVKDALVYHLYLENLSIQQLCHVKKLAF